MASQEVEHKAVIKGWENIIARLDDTQRRCAGCNTELRMYIQWSDNLKEDTRLVLECWNCMEKTYL